MVGRVENEAFDVCSVAIRGLKYFFVAVWIPWCQSERKLPALAQSIVWQQVCAGRVGGVAAGRIVWELRIMNISF